MLSKRLFKGSGIAYLLMLPFVSLSPVIVTLDMIAGLILTIFLTVEVNRKMEGK